MLQKPNGTKKLKINNMNVEENDMLVLTLLLINKGQPLNNSYKLMRVLEWQFHFIEVKKILDQIKKLYADYEIVNGVHYYKLTSEGKKFINEKYNTTLDSLLAKYPNESEIIENLFNSFSE